jgi:hypothetical protein
MRVGRISALSLATLLVANLQSTSSSSLQAGIGEWTEGEVSIEILSKNFPPFSSQDAQGNAEGYTHDFLLELFRVAGLENAPEKPNRKVSITTTFLDGLGDIFQTLQSPQCAHTTTNGSSTRKLCIAAAAISITAQREENMVPMTPHIASPYRSRERRRACVCSCMCHERKQACMCVHVCVTMCHRVCARARARVCASFLSLSCMVHVRVSPTLNSPLCPKPGFFADLLPVGPQGDGHGKAG